MKWTNYHSHSNFSDGIGEPELYVKAALKQNMYAYGFSEHAPVPFYNKWSLKFENLLAYINEIERLKNKYKEQIKLFLSMEIDYFDNSVIRIDNFEYLNLDYKIGAIHYLNSFDDGNIWNFDGGKTIFEKGLKQIFGNNIKKLVEYYYQQVNNMIINKKPDIIAHIDLIKKFNKGNYFFDENEKWYQNIVTQSLKVIKEYDTIIEVNTKGVLKGLNDEFYPSNFILDKCKDLNIKLCISADAHNHRDVMALLPEARNLLIAKGFKEIFIFDEKGWYPIGIKE